MIINLGMNWENFYKDNIVEYIKSLQSNPFELVTLIIDLAIVMFLLYSFFRIVRGSRAWQLIKGIAFVVVATWISGLLNLKILNWILTGIMNLGVIAIIVIFQPELRRALEQLGTNKFTQFFGIDKDLATKTKEDIYKVVIAATELSRNKTGALIVMERDIKIQDIIATGIPMGAEVSPQLLVNIFEPNTPLHDGAVVISGNKIASAACVLPLADDKDISKDLGTRHRAALGISTQSDSIVVIVSEETGKISVAKDGTLIADVREDVLKKILISNIVTKRFATEKKERRNRINEIRKKIKKDKAEKQEIKEENNDD
ncbi:MAG: diadenylate cyclase CdaA [Clostridia bacterium]|nr:diadenylate cyclase CdaA [Clostridia bacterium]